MPASTLPPARLRSRHEPGAWTSDFLLAEVVTHTVMGSVRARRTSPEVLASTRMAIPSSEPKKARPKGPVLKPRFVLNLDDDTAERLRRYAYRTKRTKNEIVRDLVIAHLEANA